MNINNLNSRLISKLEIKSDNLVKPIYFEGLKKIGSPEKFALKYYEDGIDEINFCTAAHCRILFFTNKGTVNKIGCTRTKYE